MEIAKNKVFSLPNICFRGCLAGKIIDFPGTTPKQNCIFQNCKETLYNAAQRSLDRVFRGSTGRALNSKAGLTWSLGCVLTLRTLKLANCLSPIEIVPEHLFWMRVEDFFGVVCACADSDLFTGLRHMPLISPHFHWSTVCSLRFDWSAYEFE
ncbi:hypothetical protein AVEN_184416-1 [Araneus ventricosus]|uniref:Uncharacterized protein n=1 Tax=Araneus ventricosus TaxID=182803 RepID=A0A4Y2BH11_ARAVE|nr:hypothetical protein AVEN_184416-1 [Araneus ventricosus]